MKYPLFFFIAILLTIQGCSESPDANPKMTAEQEGFARQQVQFALDERNNKLPELNPDLLTSSMSILKSWCSAPDEEGKVDVSIFWKNTSNRRLSEVSFVLAPLNDREEVLISSSDGLAYKGLKLTQFKNEPGNDRFDSVWEDVWTNKDITQMKILSIQMIFEDGTVTSTSREFLIRQVVPTLHKSDCE